MKSTQQKIVEVCNSVRDLLLEKNRKYGDSALNPSRIFAKSDAVEQIKVRIDDKLSRISTSGTSGVDEDTLQDLIGYLVLLKIATEQVEEPNLHLVTYEDVLSAAIEEAALGEKLVAEYGLTDVDDQSLEYWGEGDRVPMWDQDDEFMWDPSLGPVEPTEEEVQALLQKKCLEEFESDEIVSVIERRGLIMGFKKDGTSCVLSTNGITN